MYWFIEKKKYYIYFFFHLKYYLLRKAHILRRSSSETSTNLSNSEAAFFNDIFRSISFLPPLKKKESFVKHEKNLMLSFYNGKNTESSSLELTSVCTMYISMHIILGSSNTVEQDYFKLLWFFKYKLACFYSTVKEWLCFSGVTSMFVSSKWLDWFRKLKPFPTKYQNTLFTSETIFKDEMYTLICIFDVEVCSVQYYQ